MGCEKESGYAEIARQRLLGYFNGTLRYRPMGKPVYQPTGREKVSQIPEEWKDPSQARLLGEQGEAAKTC
jgi:adenine-specific DNA-methyltransferase